MSVLLEFTIFPTDQQESLSQYVGEVVNMIRESGFDYQLTSMGTIVETKTMAEATRLLEESMRLMQRHSKRVHCAAKFDYRAEKFNRLRGKIESIEQRIGEVNS